MIAVAPHTSNWDFVMGVATMFALDLQLAFLGKHTLFRWPVRPRCCAGWAAFPWTAASAHGVVARVDRGFPARGPTRARRSRPRARASASTHFKTGFLHIARGAGVPVVLATLDYGNKCVRFGAAFEPGEDVEADRERVEAYFAPVRASARAESDWCRDAPARGARRRRLQRSACG